MPDPQWESLKEIFHAAVALPLKERAAYLDQGCGGNQSFRAAVESLLKSHEESNNFVDQPAYRAAAESLIEDRKFGPSDVIGDYRIVPVRKETAFIQLMTELKPRWEGFRKEFERN